MKKLKWFSAGSALVAAACISLPAAAQTTVYNYGGGCSPAANGTSISCTPATGYGVTTQGWSAAAGSNFVASTLTNQGGAGVGLASGSTGDPTTSPDHGIDNNVNNEVVLLNFGTNKVVLSAVSIGWYNTDSDLALYRWNGAATGPTMGSTAASNTGLLNAGWQLVADRDMDNVGTAAAGDVAGTQSWTTALANSTASSWWLVAAYMGGGAQVADGQKDYFKLLSVSATCVSGGGVNNACGPATNGAPEPTSLALVGAALFGALRSTRRRKTAVVAA